MKIQPINNYSFCGASKIEVLNTLRKIPKEYFDFNDMKANLHIHSEYSDGRLSLGEIFHQAIWRGKKYIAVTDHNTLSHLATVEEYKEALAKKGVEIINGVELSTKNTGNVIHLLVYGADPNDEKLAKICKQAKFFNNVDTKKAVKALSEDYAVVLAHPIVYKQLGLKHFIKSLKNLGMSGVETYYPYHNIDKTVEGNPFSKKFFWSKIASFRQKLVNIPKIAEKYDLVKTGGMDAHGMNIDKTIGW